MTRPVPPVPPYRSVSGSAVEALTPEQLSQLAHARQSYRKVRRAIAIATFDAWTTAIFAALTLAGSAFGWSWPGFLLGIGMAVVAYNSFRGMRRLEQLDATGATLLGRNQLLIGLILLLYACWNLLLTARGAMPADLGASMQQLGQLGGSVNAIVEDASYLLYGGIVAFALIVQPLTSLYYFSRKSAIEKYVQQTAPWIMQMQRNGFKLG